MLSETGRMAIQRTLQRDAEAALRALTRDEAEALRRAARTGGAGGIPEAHRRRLVALCLAAEHGGGFALSPLGRCAAERLAARAAPKPPSANEDAAATTF